MVVLIRILVAIVPIRDDPSINFHPSSWIDSVHPSDGRFLCTIVVVEFNLVIDRCLRSVLKFSCSSQGLHRMDMDAF
jgi:hypothetical protein